MKQLSGSVSKKTREASPGKYSRFLLRVGFVLLMLGLIAFAIYQLVSHLTVGLDTLRTQEITEDAYVSLELYVFRDEKVIPSAGELYQYHVYDGERVGKHDTIATVHQGQGDLEAMQALLRLYAQRIGLAKRLSGGKTPDSLREINEEIDKAYLALLNASEGGHAANASDAAEKVKRGLAQYAALVGGGKNPTEDVKALQSAMTALVTDYPVTGQLAAEKSGYYYYDTDGYEMLFDVNQVMTMTPEEFLALTQSSAQVSENGGAGKMVWSATWYAAAYVSLADVAETAFEVGETYTVICRDSMETQLSMTVVRMEPTADGALIIFKSQDMPDGFAFDRHFSAQTVSNSISGYRIPTEALVTLEAPSGEKVTGVYILEGNVVEFRKVHIVVAREGYTVAATYEEVKAMLDALPEEERDKLTADGWSYLALNDKIITRGTGLYDGKMIS